MRHWIIFNGTETEKAALLHAIREHCECRREDRSVTAPCAAHAMLVGDQRALDGLLFMRNIAPRLLREEFNPT